MVENIIDLFCLFFQNEQLFIDRVKTNEMEVKSTFLCQGLVFECHLYFTNARGLCDCTVLFLHL